MCEKACGKRNKRVTGLCVGGAIKGGGGGGEGVCGGGRWGRKKGKEFFRERRRKEDRIFFWGSTGCSKEHFIWEVFSVSCQWVWKSRRRGQGMFGVFSVGRKGSKGFRVRSMKNCKEVQGRRRPGCVSVRISGEGMTGEGRRSKLGGVRGEGG